ncbi:MAG: hypothetical protein JXR37_03120 [Kiritimatiellae bacterium]|nr:hypothetical protein [Kiritimatiellia bacterium]
MSMSDEFHLERRRAKPGTQERADRLGADFRLRRQQARADYRQARGLLGRATGTRVPAPPVPHRPDRRRSGQTMIFMIMLLVILAFVVLWNFDVHKILFVKTRSQNAGDAAALAAARWQGISMNLIGELNIAQAVAITEALTRGETVFPEAEAIADLEARLCFVGPLVGLAASQQAAKNNGIFVNPDFTDRLAWHAQDVLDYNRAERWIDGQVHYAYHNVPEPPTCWDDYSEMLAMTSSEGVAAAPDNTKRYFDYYNYDHILLHKDFYDAVATRNWCWFYFHCMDLLRKWGSYHDWPELPPFLWELAFDEDLPLKERLRLQTAVNSEVFSLGLMKLWHLESLLPLVYDNISSADVNELVDKLRDLADDPVDRLVARVNANWFCFNPRYWDSWRSILPTNFPFAGPIKPEYDYAGADVVVRVEAESDRLTPGSRKHDRITWTAAAKPFGHLDGPILPNRYGMVLPSFHEVRLIPVDASSQPEQSYYDVQWREHIEKHVPEYIQDGPAKLVSGCWYCRQIATWEESTFRRTALDWLRLYSDLCHCQGPGPSAQGGTRRAH